MNRLILWLVLGTLPSCTRAPQITGSAEGTPPAATATSRSSAPLCRMDSCWSRATKEKLPEVEQKALLAEGCAQGHALSCDYLAQYHNGSRCPAGSAHCLDDEGIALARRGCELGAGAPCFYVVETLAEKLTVAEREQLYTRACLESYSVMSWAPSCAQAVKLATDRGDTQRAALIQKHFQLAQDCNEEVAAACAELALQPKWGELSH